MKTITSILTGARANDAARPRWTKVPSIGKRSRFIEVHG
jgi:hypothetical protein